MENVVKNEDVPQLSKLLENKLQNKEIVFIQEKSVVTFEELEGLRKGLGEDKSLYVCDFYIEDIDKDSEFDGSAFHKGHITNVDHHSEHEKMKIFVSSAVLALDQIENKEIKENRVVVIHHTDADSVLTTLVMSGIVKPEQAREWHFRRAAIAADHTGEKDPLADLLQSLRDGQYKGQPIEERLKFSVHNLERFLKGEEIDEDAQRLLDSYNNERASLEKMVQERNYKSVGDNHEVSWVELPSESKADAVALPALFPESIVAFIAKPQIDKDGNPTNKYEMNVRLGKPALDLKLDLRQVMKKAGLEFGGRWNAGANKRKGGTDLTPQEFAERIYEALAIS